jgi:hypothetical protein
MDLFKVGVVVVAGLGSTWAAREITDAWLGRASPSPAALVQTEPPAEPAPPAAEGGGGGPPIEEISREEMERELERARAEIAGKPARGELEEFRPSRPLAADVAIALPSDM